MYNGILCLAFFIIYTSLTKIMHKWIKVPILNLCRPNTFGERIPINFKERKQTWEFYKFYISSYHRNNLCLGSILHLNFVFKYQVNEIQSLVKQDNMNNFWRYSLWLTDFMRHVNTFSHSTAVYDIYVIVM